MDRIDACVIGAGVVGLAVGRALAMQGLETVVLERAGAIGTATSSRNSEVIHAGIYYPVGSLKARLCVAGRALLYAHCEAHGVAHARCGKLIVATRDSEVADLRRIEAQARGNGVSDLQWLGGAEARAMEPALQAEAALLSPSTGIVDSHGLMLSLQGGLESHGGAVALRSPVLGLASGREGHVVEVGGDAPMALHAGIVVNAAGLWAPGLAAHHVGLDIARLPRAGYAKGNYCALTGKAPFSRLIYPARTDVGGLGVHLTLDLAGRARFGPDVQWIAPDTPEHIDYRVDPTCADAFYDAIRRYWPALPDAALQPDYSGVRPKLQWLGEPDARAPHDFVVEGPETHGLDGLVNLFGIESPGLTACLALAAEVVRRLGLPERAGPSLHEGPAGRRNAGRVM